MVTVHHMKICLVCSHGGHMTEMMQVLDAFEKHEKILATYHSKREIKISGVSNVYLTENIGASVPRMLAAFGWALTILLRERPDVIVSMGSEIALPFFYCAWLFRIKTIFIESWCRVDNLSQTGRLVYPVATEFWVQWPQLLDSCGSKAEYKGAVT